MSAAPSIDGSRCGDRHVGQLGQGRSPAGTCRRSAPIHPSPEGPPNTDRRVFGPPERRGCVQHSRSRGNTSPLGYYQRGILSSSRTSAVACRRCSLAVTLQRDPGAMRCRRDAQRPRPTARLRRQVTKRPRPSWSQELGLFLNERNAAELSGPAYCQRPLTRPFPATIIEFALSRLRLSEAINTGPFLLGYLRRGSSDSLIWSFQTTNRRLR